MEFSKEMIEKAKEAKSVEELMEMAQAEGVELSKAEAENYYSFLHTEGELSDEELSEVAGGKGGDNPPPKYSAGMNVTRTVYDHTYYGTVTCVVQGSYNKTLKWSYWVHWSSVYDSHLRQRKSLDASVEARLETDTTFHVG